MYFWNDIAEKLLMLFVTHTLIKSGVKTISFQHFGLAKDQPFLSFSDFKKGSMPLFLPCSAVVIAFT